MMESTMLVVANIYNNSVELEKMYVNTTALNQVILNGLALYCYMFHKNLENE